jgi:pilus assembly protein Flp/PilA
MRKLFHKWTMRFLMEASGATAIEYALIAAGIALTIIAAVNGAGTSVSGLFASVSSSLK